MSEHTLGAQVSRQQVFRRMCDVAHRMGLAVGNPNSDSSYIENIPVKVDIRVPAFRHYRLVGTLYWKMNLSQSIGMCHLRYARGSRGEFLSNIPAPDGRTYSELAWTAFDEQWRVNVGPFGKVFLEGGLMSLDVKDPSEVTCIYEVV